MDEADETPGGAGRRSEPPGGGGPPTTDQLRIAAVEAAVAAGLQQAPGNGAGPAAGAVARPTPGGTGEEARSGQRAPVEAPPAVAALPDWVDPPTGQVPAVLLEAAGDAGEHPAGSRGPTWREQAADWDDDLGLGPLDEAADETIGVAGRDVEAGLLEGPIDFAELDDDPRRAAPDPVQRAAPVGPPAPGAGPPADVLDDVAGEDAWAAFAAAGEPAASAAPPRRRRGAAGRHRRVAPQDDVAPSPVADEPAARPAARPAADVPGPAVPAGPVPEHHRPTPSFPSPAAPRPLRGARRRPADPGRRNPVVATLTGVVAGAIAVACFLGGAVPALALVAVVATLAAGEACATLRRADRRPATLVVLVGVPALVVGAYLRGPIAVPVVLACCTVVTAIWYLSQATEPPGSPAAGGSPAADLGATLLVLAWVGVLASFAGLLLSPARFPDRHGVAYVLAALVLTVAHDVGSYAAGATLGRHKVVPRVSPNKTWEGLAGGTVLAFLAAVGVAQIHPIALGTAVGLAALVTVLGPLGDLTESLVKRDLGVKDMGRVLPAHGGFFDRIDAMLFVLPAAYFLFRVAHPS